MRPTGFQFDPSPHEHQVTGSDFPGTISNYENLQVVHGGTHSLANYPQSPTIRANPFPEVTGLICRLPLFTFSS